MKKKIKKNDCKVLFLFNLKSGHCVAHNVEIYGGSWMKKMGTSADLQKTSVHLLTMLKSSFNVMTLLNRKPSLIPQSYEDENLWKK